MEVEVKKQEDDLDMFKEGELNNKAMKFKHRWFNQISNE